MTSVTGFYIFEGSFFQGGGGWEEIELHADRGGVEQAALTYMMESHWTTGVVDEECAITVVDGGSSRVHDLYPHTRIKVPGLTEVTFGPDGRIGGAPEPGGRYADHDEATLWNETQIAADIAELAAGSPSLITVVIDWDAIALPRVSDPLPETHGVVLPQDAERALIVPPLSTVSDYLAARNRLIARFGEPEVDVDDPDDDADVEQTFDELVQEYDDLRYLTYGYNSVFDY